MHCFLLLPNNTETPLVGVLVEIVFILFYVHLVEDGRLGGLESVKQAYGMTLAALYICGRIHDHSKESRRGIRMMYTHPNHL